MQKAQELHWRNFHIDVIYKQNIAEKVKKTPNLWIANIYKTMSCSCSCQDQDDPDRQEYLYRDMRNNKPRRSLQNENSASGES